MTTAAVGSGAVLNHTRIEHESADAFHISLLEIEQQRSSSVVQRSFLSGGALVRNEIAASLEAEGAYSFPGRALPRRWCPAHRQSHPDRPSQSPLRQLTSSTRAFSTAPHAGSSTGGSSFARTRRRPTPSRRIGISFFPKTPPSIPSRAGDSTPTCQCTHGATIGQLDEEAIFYLQSRGIAKAEARASADRLHSPATSWTGSRWSVDYAENGSEQIRSDWRRLRCRLPLTSLRL